MSIAWKARFAGLEKVCEQGILIDSIGIDTWGVDYVLLDKQGQRVGLPVSYRDTAPRA
jgi:rhamnulokinase